MKSAPLLLKYSLVVILVALAWGDVGFAQPPSPGFLENSVGWTPLHEAALRDQFVVSESLLASNAAVNAKDALGATPLHAAAFRGSSNIVELLLAHKAEVNATNNDGVTPLFITVQFQFEHREVA
ncbi:MAG TPA: ankyrin repeat domain-containing protein, partial [Candidatus Baltobacteraceae bacterium]|nr:ankyrin repeat domain-containing protein [Candidatus Baltobacteraceae bacterium]